MITDTLNQSQDGFDIIIMNMAVMDVADLKPLAQVLPYLLHKNGV